MALAAQLASAPSLELPSSGGRCFRVRLDRSTPQLRGLDEGPQRAVSVASASLPLAGPVFIFLALRATPDRYLASTTSVGSVGRIRQSRAQARPPFRFLRAARWERLRRRAAALLLAFAVLAAAWGGSLSNSRADLFRSRLERGGQAEYIYRPTPFREGRRWQGRVAAVASPSDIPSPWWRGTGFVSDTARLLRGSTVRRINRLARDIRSKTGAEVVVVTVRRIKGAAEDRDEIKTFATDLFNLWGLGDQYKNNGVLILVDVGDRRVEVEIGSGLNGPFKRDGWLRGMIDERILPPLRHRDFDEGILAGATSCCQKLLDTDLEVSSPLRLRNRAWLLWGASAVSAWFGAMLLSGRTLAQPPKCSRCGGRMSRLREAGDAELDEGQKAERDLNSVRHLLCVCNRPGCRASWSKPSSVRRFAGTRRIGGATDRARELKLTPEEVKEATERESAVGMITARRWMSRFHTCPSCGYKTQLSRSFKNPVTGEWSEETQCYFCNAYTCDEESLPLPVFADAYLSSTDGSSVDSSGPGEDVAWGGGFSMAGGEGGDFEAIGDDGSSATGAEGNGDESSGSREGDSKGNDGNDNARTSGSGSASEPTDLWDSGGSRSTSRSSNSSRSESWKWSWDNDNDTGDSSSTSNDSGSNSWSSSWDDSGSWDAGDSSWGGGSSDGCGDGGDF